MQFHDFGVCNKVLQILFSILHDYNNAILIAHEIDCEKCFACHDPLAKLVIRKRAQNILKVQYTCFGLI